MADIISKINETIKNDGIKSLFPKTKNYLTFRVKAGLKKQEISDILFVNGCALPHPERYRVDHQIEQLKASGLTADKVFYEDLDIEKLKYYRGFVFFRCPVTDKVEKFIERAKYFNKKVFFDIDDLVIDKKYTDKIEFVQQMGAEDKKVYDDGVVRMGKTMKMCDYLITTTSALKRELEKYGKEVYVNRNVASEKMVKLSLGALNRIKKRDDEVMIGYLSGSITHNPDFELIKPALMKIMDEYQNVKLVVMGYLDLPRDLEKYKKRIIKKPFVEWKKLPDIIAGLDINLAPIEETIFNEAKSENKWTEAALCKVATVASDFGAFKETIRDGETGVLCKTTDDWYEKLKELIENKDLRSRIGENAQQKALKEYITTYTGLPLAKFIESKLAKNIGFVLPSTNVSGGVNVVLKHCNMLRENGVDAMIINMDVSDDNVVNADGEINVVSNAKHDFATRYYGVVATLFTTLKFVKKYPNAKKRFYFVQNFETDFNEFGSPAKWEANATYADGNGIEFITISKWCKDWLEKDFGQKAKYAPNGIDLNRFRFKKRSFDGKVKILIEGNSDDYYKNVDESFRIVEKLDSNKFEIYYLSYQGEPKKWYKVDKFYHRVPYDEVAKVYEKCDILLKTSILESFSYPPLEMMATGGYVVVAPNAGNVEYLKNSNNCLFYERGNIDEAVDKINIVCEDATVRKKLLEGAIETVQARNWDIIKDKILDLYK